MERPNIKRPHGLQRLHLTDEHLLGIGYVAVRASQLDDRIEWLVMQTKPLFVESISETICGLSVPKKLNLIGEWLRVDLPDKHKPISEFINRAHGVRGERDHVIHRVYRKTDKDEVKELIDRRKGVPKVIKQVTPSDLLELGERILGITGELDGWTAEALEAAQAARAPSLARPDPLVEPPSCSAMSRARLRGGRTLAEQQLSQLPPFRG